MEHSMPNLKNELDLIRERYSKLLDAHKIIQEQNCLLEERILSMVENYSHENENLRLAEEEICHLKKTIHELEDEKQRYKNDCNLAVRLLQQNPTEFHSTTSSQNLVVPTFPPTNFATAFPLVNTTDHHVQSLVKDPHCFICSHCHRTIHYSDASVQTSATSISIEPVHSYMTINEYQRGSSTKTSSDIGISSTDMPQTHTV